MKAKECLFKYFGYQEFRPHQEEIVESILSGFDTLAIMPTGFGKSICFQVPALAMEGVTIVITPLISLMNDQVYQLKKKRIKACCINSTMEYYEYHQIMDSLSSYKFIYVSPERLVNYEFLSLIFKINISLIVVDEAHCISMWGLDFRQSYLDIKDFIAKIPKRPVVACFTATATKEVEDDIISKIGLLDHQKFSFLYLRRNLFYRVVQPKDKLEYIKGFLEDNHKTGIIYAKTRKNVELIYEKIYDLGYPCAKYHGGLNEEERNISLNNFLKSDYIIMVATNAFGMGINKVDVRFVIHYDTPLTLEDYYQESGRAGRDGLYSDCILLFSNKDLYVNNILIENGEYDNLSDLEVKQIKKHKKLKLDAMVKYANSKGCYNHFIMDYFGYDSSDKCDCCANCLTSYDNLDVICETKLIINLLLENPNGLFLKTIVEVLIGFDSDYVKKMQLDKSSFFKSLSCDYDFLKEIILSLERINIISRTEEKYSKIILNTESKKVLELKELIIPISKSFSLFNQTRNKKMSLKNQLLSFRDKKAKLYGFPSFMVLPLDVIKEIVKMKPKNKDDLLNIKGMSSKRVSRYGDEILQIVKNSVK